MLDPVTFLMHRNIAFAANDNQIAIAIVAVVAHQTQNILH